MKVLMLFGLIVVTVWAYPVAESDGATSSSMVYYYSKLESSESDSSASSASSETSSEEHIHEAEREPEKTSSLEVSKDVEPIVNPLKSEDHLATDAVHDGQLPSQPDTAPVIEQKSVLPDASLADKAEQPVEIPEAPIALPTLNTQVNEHKDELLKADEPKVDVLVSATADEDIKLDASEVKTVEEPAIVAKEDIPLGVAKTPAEQDALPSVGIANQEDSEVAASADPLPVQAEKKERKDDVPIPLPIEVPQQEPIQLEGEVSKPELPAAPLVVGVPAEIVQAVPLPVEIKLDEEPAIAANPSEEVLAVPAATEPEKTQADPIVAQPEASEPLPVEIPVAGDLHKPEETAPIAAVVVSEDVRALPEQPTDAKLADVQAAPVESAEQNVDPQQQQQQQVKEDAPVAVPQADIVAPTDPVVEEVKPAESEVSNNALKEAH